MSCGCGCSCGCGGGGNKVRLISIDAGRNDRPIIIGSGATVSGYHCFDDGGDLPGHGVTNASVAIGKGAQSNAGSTDSGSVVIGPSAKATTGAVSLGAAAGSTDSYHGVSIGQWAVGTSYSVAIGSSAQAGGSYAIAIGQGASAPAEYGIAIGKMTVAGNRSVVIGVCANNCGSSPGIIFIKAGCGTGGRNVIKLDNNGITFKIDGVCKTITSQKFFAAFN